MESGASTSGCVGKYNNNKRAIIMTKICGFCDDPITNNKSNNPKYCGNQFDKKSCSYKELKRGSAKQVRTPKLRACLTCDSLFTVYHPNKLYCGNMHNKSSCVALHIAAEKLKERPKLEIVHKVSVREEYITPRILQRRLIREHNYRCKR